MKKPLIKFTREASGAHRCQCLRSHEAADDDGIHGIIHLLKKGTQQNGEEKEQQLFPDHAFGDLLHIPVPFHKTVSLHGFI